MAKHISLKELTKIVGKASKNAAFKRKLTKSPASTLRGLGYEPHKQAVAVIRSLKHKSFAKAPAKKKRRSARGKSMGEN